MSVKPTLLDAPLSAIVGKKSVQRPAMRNPDVSAIAGHFPTNGRKKFRLSSGLRPHDSRNFLRPFVGKCPAIALTSGFLCSIAGCWTRLTVAGRPGMLTASSVHLLQKPTVTGRNKKMRTVDFKN